MADAADSSRADHVYGMGPETLVAQSFAIITGPVSGYSKQIVESSQPGPDGFPLRWVVSGRIARPEVIKGKVASGEAVSFTRPEQSGMLPQPPTLSAWEREQGDLMPADDALLFFLGDPAKPTVKVVPSRDADAGLAALVRRIVRIQALPDPSQRNAAWLAYLQAARSEEAQRASLRQLMANRTAGWAQLQPVLSALLVRSDLSEQIRAFTAGIIAFGVVNGRWREQQLDAVDFVCRQFETAGAPWLALQQMLTLKQLLAYASSDHADPARLQLRQRIVQSLRRRAAAPLPPELDAQYRQLRDAFPGEL